MVNKVRIGVLGSCSTRNVFTTQYNDYKEHFELVFSYERISLISLFQDPICYDENDIIIYPDNPTNRFRTRNIKKDFDKSLFNDLNNNVDYIILDFYFEALFGVLLFDDKIITNNVWDLPQTNFYKNIENSKVCSMYENPEEYFKLWANSCDKLFDYLNEFCPDVKIILNKMSLVDKVLRDDYSCYTNTDFRWMVEIYSVFTSKFEDYVQQNFNVETIESPYENYTSENNRWRPYVVHHTDDYYKFLYFKICEIVGIDDLHLVLSQLNYILERLELYGGLISNTNNFDENINISDSDENHAFSKKLLKNFKRVKKHFK